MTTALFPFAQYWWFYAAFAGLVGLLLATDLAAHRAPRPFSMNRALRWSVFWAALGLGFSVVVYLLAASHYSGAIARQAGL